MLFDLKGKRRRVVQATYLGLALLMGIGLVGAGIGSDATGGLFDAFRSDGGGDNGNSIVEKRIDDAQKRLRANPRDEAALKQLVRSHYQLAVSDADRNTGAFGARGKQELRRADAAWTRYLALPPERPDVSLARLMVQAYTGIGQGLEPQDAQRYYAKGAEAAEIVAVDRESPEAYLQLVQLATLAGQSRKAELAGKKAIQLAPKRDRDTVRQLVDQAKAAAATQQGQGGAPPPQP